MCQGLGERWGREPVVALSLGGLPLLSSLAMTERPEGDKPAMEAASRVEGPVWYPGFGWEIRLYFENKEAAQGFAAFAANGFTARQPAHAPLLQWVPVMGGDVTGPLPPVQALIVYAVDTSGPDNVVKVEYAPLLSDN